MLVHLVETFWTNSGHHRLWFARLLEMLTRSGHEVVCFCPNLADLPGITRGWPEEMRARIHTGRSLPEMPIVPRFWHRWIFAIADRAVRWAWIWRTLRRDARARGRSPDLVFFAFSDLYAIGEPRLAAWMGRRAFAPWIGLYFWLNASEVRSLNAASGPLRRDRLALFRSPACQGICVFDEDMAAAASERPLRHCWTMPDFTDPVTRPETSSLAREMLEKAAGRPVVLICGHLGPRKGILEFLRLALASPPGDWLFAAAGKMEPEIFAAEDRSFLAALRDAPPENVWLHPHRVEEEETFNDLIRNCSVLYAVYLDFPFSSGLLAKSACFEKPILVSDRFVMGRRVLEHNTGRAVPEKDIPALQSALASLREDPPPPDGFRAYRSFHCLEKFESMLGDVLREATIPSAGE